MCGRSFWTTSGSRGVPRMAPPSNGAPTEAITVSVNRQALADVIPSAAEADVYKPHRVTIGRPSVPACEISFKSSTSTGRSTSGPATIGRAGPLRYRVRAISSNRRLRHLPYRRREAVALGVQQFQQLLVSGMVHRPAQLRFDARPLPLQLFSRHFDSPGIAAAIAMDITCSDR